MYLSDREINNLIENSRNEEMCGGPEPIGYSDRFSSNKPKKMPRELRMKTIAKYSCPRQQCFDGEQNFDFHSTLTYLLLQMPYSKVMEIYTVDKDSIEVYNNVKHYITKNQVGEMTSFCLSCCHPDTFVKEVLKPFVEYTIGTTKELPIGLRRIVTQDYRRLFSVGKELNVNAPLGLAEYVHSMELFKSDLVIEVQTILDSLGDDFNKQFLSLFEPLINGTPYTLEIRDTITRIWTNAEYCEVGREFMFSGDIHTKDKMIVFDETIDNLFSILINHYISTRSVYYQLTNARQGK